MSEIAANERSKIKLWKTPIYKHWLVLHSNAIIILILGLMFLSVAVENSALSIFIIVLAIIIGLPSPESLFPVFFIASLSGDYFGAFQGIGFPRIFGIIICAGSLKRIISHGRIEKKYLIYCVLIASTTFISYLNAYVDSFTNLMTILLNLLILLALINLQLSETEIKRLFDNTYFAAKITILYFAALLLFVPYSHIRSDFQGTTVSAELNPNTFSQMLAQLAAFCFGYMIVNKQRLAGKIVAFILGLFCVYCIFRTGSRAGTLAIILGALFAASIYLIVKKKSIANVGMFIMITLALITLSYVILATNPELAERMNLTSLIETGGSERWTYIQIEALYIIPEHPLFGVGIGTSNEVEALSPYFAYTPYSSTNLLFSMLTQVGIIGFLAYVLFFIKIIKDTIKELRYNQMIFIPLILIMVAIFNGMGEVVFYERYFWNALSLAAMCIVNYRHVNTYNIRCFQAARQRRI